MRRSGRFASLVVVLVLSAETAEAQSDDPQPPPEEPPPPAATPPVAPPAPPPPPQAPPAPPRLAFGPSLAFGFTTPSSGSLFTNVYALVDLRFVVAIRAVGPLWVRLEPGTTMSWDNTNAFLAKLRPDGSSEIGASPDRSETVRIHTVGARALMAFEASSRVFVRGGGSLMYGAAGLPDFCGGETRGGFGGGGILGAGFRVDPDRRLEIGVETAVLIYPFGDRCVVIPAAREARVRLQENPELAMTVGATWFFF